MNNFLKILAIILISNIVNAQTKNDRIKLGLRGGVNLSQFVISGQYAFQEVKDGIKPIVSYNFGTYTNIPISESFTFQPGLSFVGKGTKLEINRNGVLITGFGAVGYNQVFKQQINIAYLETPLNLLFNYKNFFVGAGPYVAYALFGKEKISDVITLNTGTKVRDNNPPDRKIILGNSDNADISRWDIGANTTLGYKLNNGLNFSANYAINLAKTKLKSDYNVDMSNRVLTFLIGYEF